MRTLTCLLIVCLLPAVAAGRDIFVDNSAGDDRYSGQQSQTGPDLTGPVRTIAKALRLADRGDRIVLAKTELPYRETVTLSGGRNSGYAYQPFVIAGNGAILDGSAPVPNEAWKHHQGAVFRFRPPAKAYQQLFINDRPAVRVVAKAMAANPPKLAAFEWCLHQGDIYFCVEKGKLPQDYRLTYAHLPTGITLCQAERVIITDLTVQGYQLDGINACNGARQIHLGGITCRGNGRSGVTVGGASIVELEGCLLGNNGVAQLLTLPWSETHIHQSELLGNTAAAWVDQGGAVYLGERRIQGGLDKVKADDSEPAKK